MTFVLDTSAILSRRFNLSDPEVILPDLVVDEIRKGKLKSMLDSMDEMLRVVSPSEDSMCTVRENAAESGDLKSLSETDLQVLAVAYETNSTIITDDFAIQNVASLMSISYSGADLSGIKHEVKWRYRCTGCHRIYESPVGKCGVCGHEVVRSRAGARMKKK